MSCRRHCRELLWLARFGEFGPSSQPHLDHLAGCRSCRDEVGFDRAMVEQLRIALAARIEHASPSPSAFERIVARAQRPEPRPAARIWEWSTAVVGRLRFATAMAGTGLALVLALNMDIVPVTVPAAPAAADETAVLQQVPRILPVRSPLAELTRAWDSNVGVVSQPDPESLLTVGGRPPQSRAVTDGLAASERPTELRIVFRATQTPDPGTGAAASPDETTGDAPAPAGTEPGKPS
jgi:hypothetical protein